jgi:uncharacterized damage-inducible protein DinB
MTRSDLADAFDHHVWASVRLIDTCMQLTPGRLVESVPGTYGPILDTLRHLVGADAWYLFVIGGERMPRIDEDQMDLTELRAQMESHGELWSAIVAEGREADTEIVAHRRHDGSESHAPLGIRLAQALHHGTDHRSQICTGLTSLGVDPPDIDVWAYGELDGRVFDLPPNP